MQDPCPKCGDRSLESVQLVMYRDGVQVENDVSVHCKKCGMMLVEQKNNNIPLPPLSNPPLPS